MRGADLYILILYLEVIRFEEKGSRSESEIEVLF